MINLPRLNQTCTKYESTVNKYGKKTVGASTTNIACRYSISTKKVVIGIGQIVEYSGNIHAQNNTFKNGDILLLENGLYYEIIDAKNTYDLQGNLGFQFAYLKETYVTA
jgi:3-phosphoglycerate kinase